MNDKASHAREALIYVDRHGYEIKVNPEEARIIENLKAADDRARAAEQFPPSPAMTVAELRDELNRLIESGKGAYTLRYNDVERRATHVIESVGETDLAAILNGRPTSSPKADLSFR